MPEQPYKTQIYYKWPLQKIFCNTDSSSGSVCAPSNFIDMNGPVWHNGITHMQKTYFRGNSSFKIHKEDEVLKQLSVKAFL